MELYYLVLFATFQTQAVDLDVEGEVSFHLKIPKHLQYKIRSLTSESNVTQNVTIDNDNLVMKMEYSKSVVTVGPRVECLYQYPENVQVQAILSNMMNELTKVFVRAHDLMKEDYRRRGSSRFIIVAKKNTDFFENIYGNMTKEYLKLYNTTTERVDRSEKNKDPCEHQEEVKQLWKDILDNSLIMFRRAAFECIEEHLKIQNRSTDGKARGRLSQFLMRELKKVRMHQLVLLCDKYQLCFNELV